jgi:hypothetical protein
VRRLAGYLLEGVDMSTLAWIVIVALAVIGLFALLANV